VFGTWGSQVQILPLRPALSSNLDGFRQRARQCFAEHRENASKFWVVLQIINPFAANLQLVCRPRRSTFGDDERHFCTFGLLLSRPSRDLAQMPRGPKGENRPADVICNAVKVMRIATGEEPEDYGPNAEAEGKNAAVVALGRMGGKARAAGLSARSAGRSPRRQLRHVGRSAARTQSRADIASPSWVSRVDSVRRAS
jgi:hypothetical protein